jgi:hypothetical protein
LQGAELISQSAAGILHQHEARHAEFALRPPIDLARLFPRDAAV